MSQWITTVEENLLIDIDKMVKFYTRQGIKPDHITVSKKQFNALQKLEKKAAKGSLYRSDENGGGQVDLTPGAYQGVSFSVLGTPRRSHKKKDTMDWINA